MNYVIRTKYTCYCIINVFIFQTSRETILLARASAVVKNEQGEIAFPLTTTWLDLEKFTYFK